MNRLEGRIAVVTAAGSGMGRASSIRFAAEGAHVVVSDKDEAAAKAVADEITAAGDAATSVGCDVGDLNQVKSMINGVARTHGVIHVLFNHAGIPGAAGLDIAPVTGRILSTLTSEAPSTRPPTRSPSFVAPKARAPSSSPPRCQEWSAPRSARCTR